MLTFGPTTKIYLAVGGTDMRKSFDALSADLGLVAGTSRARRIQLVGGPALRAAWARLAGTPRDEQAFEGRSLDGITLMPLAFLIASVRAIGMLTISVGVDVGYVARPLQGLAQGRTAIAIEGLTVGTSVGAGLVF